MSVFDRNQKIRFFLRNLARGLIWFVVLILGYFLVRNYLDFDFSGYLEPYFENTLLILIIFTLSEIFFGIIPPELFMIWALRFGNLAEYSFFILVFSVISYLAGYLGFLVGNYLGSTILYRYFRKKYMGKYHSLLQKYGFFLILVAALTPLPYSAISMLIGSLGYSRRKYLIFALARFLRFAIYATILWNAGKVSPGFVFLY